MKATLEEMRAPDDLARHAVAVIQSTLPQFGFPSEAGGCDAPAAGPVERVAGAAGGAAGAAREATVRVQLAVLPGGGTVTLRLLTRASSAETAAPAPSASTLPAGSSGASRQGVVTAGGERCPAASRGSPASWSSAAGSAAASGSAGGAAGGACEIGPEEAAPPARLAAGVAPAGGAAPPQPAGRRPRPAPSWVPADVADMLASGDMDSMTAMLLFSPDPWPPGWARPSAHQQLLQLARERWALFSAGLLGGPSLAVSAAVFAATAALAGAHLAAALASPAPPSSLP